MQTNVKTAISGNILTITVDLSERHGPSASGKTVIVATSGGNIPVGNGIFLGLNVYEKAGAAGNVRRIA